jgi:hypothetical protein
MPQLCHELDENLQLGAAQLLREDGQRLLQSWGSAPLF